MLSNEQLKTGLLLLAAALEGHRQLDGNEARQLGNFIVQCVGDQALNKALQDKQAHLSGILSDKVMNFMLDITYLPRHWNSARPSFEATYSNFINVKNNHPLSEEQKEPMEVFMQHLAVFHEMARLQPHFAPLEKLNVTTMNAQLSALHEKIKMCHHLDSYLDQRASAAFLAGHRTTWKAGLFAQAIQSLATNERPTLRNDIEPGK